MSVVLLVGLDEGHSLYQVNDWNTTETLRIFLCLSVFGRYIYYCVRRYLGDIYFLVVLLVGLDKRHSLYRVHIGIPLRLFVWYCVCRYLN